MTAKEALDAANDAEPGERLRRYSAVVMEPGWPFGNQCPVERHNHKIHQVSLPSVRV